MTSPPPQVPAGPVTLVVGAGGGVGRAVSIALDEAGHRLALLDQDGEAVMETARLLGREPVTVGADITDPAQVREACARVERDLGQVEVLVSAAGIYGERTPFTTAEPDAWWRVLETNVRGPALCTSCVLPGMVARGRGVIVHIGSRAAVWDDPGQSSVAYSTSKAALARFTEAVAAEVAGTGVTIVDLSPGMVRTGMTAGRADLADLPDAAFLPLGLVADKVVALASGRYASLHGRFIHATDDLDRLSDHIAAAPSARRLSLEPAGPDDPLATTRR